MRALMMTAMLASACSAYNPDLGASPFLCGDSDPVCPDGYQCGQDSTGRNVCIQGGGSGAMGMCNNDTGIEPNDNIMQAVPTAVESGGLMHLVLTQLAICPGSDKDVFRIDIATEKDNLDVVLTFDDPSAPLALTVLASNNMSIVNGQSSGEDQLTAHAPNLAVGSYYAQVSSPMMMNNNYRLEITTTH